MKKNQTEQENDEEEYKTNIMQSERIVLPSGQEIEKEYTFDGDVQLVQQRIQNIVKILNNFQFSKEGKSRTDYVDQLIADIALYYGYTPWLAETLFHLFTPSEALEFFEANEVPRPITIRTNTLKKHEDGI